MTLPFVVTLAPPGSSLTSTEITPAVPSNTLVTRPEQPPQVIPVIVISCTSLAMWTNSKAPLCQAVVGWFSDQAGGVQRFNSSELVTTLTEDSDIAAAAKAGGRNQPVNGNSSPMASGTPTTL